MVMSQAWPTGQAFGIRTWDLRMTRPSEIVTACGTWAHQILFSQISTQVMVRLEAIMSWRKRLGFRQLPCHEGAL